MKFLSDEFLAKFEYQTPPFGILGEFVFLRTYSRWLPEKKRRETWQETVARTVEYNVGLYRGPETHENLVKEAEDLFDLIFNLKILPSGRSLWIGGTEASKKFGTAAFNCSFKVINDLNSFAEIFHLLMVGAGVGFRVLPEDVAHLPLLRKTVTFLHKDYEPVTKNKRLEDTFYNQSLSKKGFLVIGDSKKGWIDALANVLYLLTTDVEEINFNYDSVRGKGEILKTFGGRAAGPESIRSMFEQIEKVIQSAPEVKPGWVKLRPIDCLDICNIIGYYVVVGGVRRTSEICLFDINDTDVLNAKKDLWVEGSPNYGKVWRSMSNNSIYFTKKPDLEQIKAIFQTIRNNGEPGFVNSVAASQRRSNFQGINPCAEILLDDRGVCNLCEVNMMAMFDDYGRFNTSLLNFAVRMATRLAMRQTNITLDLENWDATQKRDRLTGVSLMGWCDLVDKLELSEENQIALLTAIRELANTESVQYAYQMRIPIPLLVTTVKPGGTLPQLPTVSSGCHRSYAPYYIRRIRITASDPLAKVMLDLGFPTYPENGQGPIPAEFDKLSALEQLDALYKANTWVIEFPVKTSAKMESNSEDAINQFNRYLMFQRNYTDHNTSITIYVADNEWDMLAETILEHWNEYIAVSFLPKNTSAYQLMPYQTINEYEYEQRKKKIPENFSLEMLSLLTDYEKNELLEDDLSDLGCEGGACPLR